MNFANILGLIIINGIFLFGAVSCVETEKTEMITAEITAAQLEGRNEARKFVAKDWKDTVELQKQLLEAKSCQSKYIINNKPECAAAFDSTFISTIRTVNPKLAETIEKGRH